MEKRSKSIREHIVLPILVIMLLQAALFLVSIFFGGVTKSLKHNAIDILNENTKNNKLYMEKEIVHRWMKEMDNIDGMTEEIENILTAGNRTAGDIRNDSQLNKEIMSRVTPRIIELLHRSYATGVFVVLDGPAAENTEEGIQAGIYIRDLDTSNYAQDNSDLLLERGLPSLASSYGIALDSFWELGFDFRSGAEGAEYFFAPFDSALINHARKGSEKNFGYMSRPFSLHAQDTQVISYSVPLIVNDDEVIGVVGLDMTLSQIQSFMVSDKQEHGVGYISMLGVHRAGENRVEKAVSMGNLYDRYFGKQESLDLQYDPKFNIYYMKSQDGIKWYVSMQKLDVYNKNTPFEGDEWVFLNIVDQQEVLRFYDQMRFMIMLALLLPLFLGTVCVLITGRMITAPIRGLVLELRKKRLEDHLVLKKVNIEEIDELADEIQTLSKDVAENASKISNILDHLNIPIGVFEYRKKSSNVFCSRSLLEILNWENINSCSSYIYIDAEEFKQIMERAAEYEGDMYSNVFYMENPSPKWYKLTGLSMGEDYLGVVSDITMDMVERKKLERERDYDLLTNLYNRRAFRSRTLERMGKMDVPSAMIMWDLDNLKYINDTYGHDEGDRYIVQFARQLADLEEKGAILSRYAGDEFLTFVYDSGGKEAIRCRLADFMESLKVNTLKMEGGYQIPLRVSAGVAWYPNDCENYETLVTYADFAMYTAKHSIKGIVMEFDRKNYLENSYLLAGKEELNRIFEEKRIKFAYQPIVDRNGEIYGYEMLMRPKMEKLKSVGEVLNLARNQAKLSQMESLTWNAGLEAAGEMRQNGRMAKDTHIFINSISSACLSKLEIAVLEMKYRDFLDRVVIEFTESEPMASDCLSVKMSTAAAWKARIAIDDYGSGYNSEALLLQIKPDIIKLDMGLVRNIDKDRKRRMLVGNMIAFAKQQNIKVLAEGVETSEELLVLMDLNVDLFQGYYIGHPDEEVRPVPPHILQKMRGNT